MMIPTQEQLRARLQGLMDISGATQPDLARYAGLHVSTVNSRLSGSHLDFTTACELATALVLRSADVPHARRFAVMADVSQQLEQPVLSSKMLRLLVDVQAGVSLVLWSARRLRGMDAEGFIARHGDGWKITPAGSEAIASNNAPRFWLLRTVAVDLGVSVSQLARLCRSAPGVSYYYGQVRLTVESIEWLRAAVADERRKREDAKDEPKPLSAIERARARRYNRLLSLISKAGGQVPFHLLVADAGHELKTVRKDLRALVAAGQLVVGYTSQHYAVYSLAAGCVLPSDLRSKDDVSRTPKS